MAKVYKTIYEDIYTIHAKHGRISPKNRDENYWKILAEEMSEYSKKHNEDKFITGLLVAVYGELSREYKEVHNDD